WAGGAGTGGRRHRPAGRGDLLPRLRLHRVPPTARTRAGRRRQRRALLGGPSESGSAHPDLPDGPVTGGPLRADPHARRAICPPRGEQQRRRDPRLFLPEVQPLVLPAGALNSRSRRPMPAKPIVVGVAGGSGSGKSTVVAQLVEALGTEQVAVVAQDHY